MSVMSVVVVSFLGIVVFRVKIIAVVHPFNKAGYTANTSRGRVGRGGNACFHTFQLDHHGPTNQPTDQPTDGGTKPLIESLVRD